MKENNLDFLFHGIIGRSGNFYEKLITEVSGKFVMQTHLNLSMSDDELKYKIIDSLDIGCIKECLYSKKSELTEFSKSYFDKRQLTHHIFMMTLAVGNVYVNFKMDTTQEEQLTIFDGCDCLKDLVLKISSIDFN